MLDELVSYKNAETSFISSPRASLADLDDYL